MGAEGSVTNSSDISIRLLCHTGANLGEYGLLAAKMGRHSIMVEPMPANAIKVEQSIGANAWTVADSSAAGAGTVPEGRVHLVHGAISCTPVLHI